MLKKVSGYFGNRKSLIEATTTFNKEQGFRVNMETRTVELNGGAGGGVRPHQDKISHTSDNDQFYHKCMNPSAL